MTALAADRTTGRGKVEGVDLSFVITNGSTVYTGGLALISDAGLVPATWATAGLRWGGVVIRGGTGDSGGTVTATVRRRGTWSFAKASAAAADLGKLAYAVDDQTVATSAGTNNAYIAGQIIKIIDSSTVEVDLGIRVA